MTSPPQPPENPPPPPEGRYDKKVLWTTAGLTIVLVIFLTVGLVGFFPFNLGVPLLALIASLVVIVRAKDMRSRSIGQGMLIGFGLALLLSAGTCAAAIAVVLGSE